MPTETTYTSARANFATLCNDVAATRDVVIIKRRGGEHVALVAAAELNSLMETAHLLRSPENAKRLLRAMVRAKNRTLKPTTLAELRQSVGLGK